jgi:hypothetical protein
MFGSVASQSPNTHTAKRALSGVAVEWIGETAHKTSCLLINWPPRLSRHRCTCPMIVPSRDAP